MQCKSVVPQKPLSRPSLCFFFFFLSWILKVPCSRSLRLVQNSPKPNTPRPFCSGSRSQMKQFLSEPLMIDWSCLQHIPSVDSFPREMGRIAGHSPAQFSPSSLPPPLRLRICHWSYWYLVSGHWINLNWGDMLKTTNHPRLFWCGRIFLTHPQNYVHHVGLSHFTLLFTSNQLVLVNLTGCSFREP